MYLKDLIRSKIKESGPISFGDFIEIAMYHKKYGYYIKKNPIGRLQDYVTSPHITSLFGQIIAIWLIDRWQTLLGDSQEIILAELGPGSGIMMLDILNIVKKFKQLYKKLDIYMIEVSPSLKIEQEKNLISHLVKLNWCQSIDQLPKKPTIFVANEFFDALPINQFAFSNGKWFENKITKDFAIKKCITNFRAKTDDQDSKELIIERCDLGKEIVQKMQNQVKSFGGAGLIIDYGYTKNRHRSTLQAIKSHKYCDLFESIGDADITHEVDFGYLFADCKVCSQKDFLLSHGIMQRVQSGIKNMTQKNASELVKSAQRLTLAQYMGEIFKCAMF